MFASRSATSHMPMRHMQSSGSFRNRRQSAATPSWIVKSSPIHGYGVFARRAIPPGTCIIEYMGERIDWAEAERRAQERQTSLSHTYYFSLHDGRVIDGGSNGNEARFINHSCEPNCEAIEDADGRVFICSSRPVERGEELSYHYALIYEGRHTAAVKRAFECHCGAPGCAGTFLAPKRRNRTR